MRLAFLFLGAVGWFIGSVVAWKGGVFFWAGVAFGLSNICTFELLKEFRERWRLLSVVEEEERGRLR